MMTFLVCLKKARQATQSRLRLYFEKLWDPDVAQTFQATKYGKFAPFIGLRDGDMDIDTMITTHNTALTDAASEKPGKICRSKKPWITDVLDFCAERRNLNRRRYDAERANAYRILYF